ncbi:MAG TPA: competence/damage-inducible protein A [Actinomycetota bacterium]|nr:competence/damage-inducible protein A [Actinomycetota bacterium]
MTTGAKAPSEAEIIAIGNELLLGETVDTNSAHVARRLSQIGLRVTRTTHAGDDAERLRGVLEEALARSRWVIAMGGLGPTRDDVTRPVVAEVIGRPLRIDPDLLAEVEAKFRRFGYERMPPANRSQAEVPEGARTIPNPHGTAPGLVLEKDGTTLFVLPGVPAEMKALLEDGVLPTIGGELGEDATVIRSRLVRTAGIGESALAEEIDDLVGNAGPIQVAFLPELGQVDIRLTAVGIPAEEADRRLEELATAIRRRVGRWFFGEGEITLAGALRDALRSRDWTLAVAESCTAGELAAEITSVPGSSDYFLGGVVSYANAVKASLLGVAPETLERHGAVSEETCREMVAGVRERLEADVGAAITGVAGPGGGTPEKPVGLVHCGVGTPEGSCFRRLDVPGSRDAVRRRATVATLSLLLRKVRGKEPS